MTFANYERFTPLFHSEVTSSYMLFEALQDETICSRFIKSSTGKVAGDGCATYREKRLGDVGSIDLLMEAKIDGRNSVVLIECKVHDYISATKDQIMRYYRKAQDLYADRDVYFIYVTQFNAGNVVGLDDLSLPPTIDEFLRAKDNLDHHERIFHVTWADVHEYLRKDSGRMSEELKHIVELHREWMKVKNRTDFQNHTVNQGERGLGDYLPDVNVDICKELPFGSRRAVSGRENWVIELAKCTGGELERVLHVIKAFHGSSKLIPFPSSDTLEDTRAAAKVFLKKLISEDSWVTSSFYTQIFSLAASSQLLRLNGTGVHGFSVLVKIKDKGQISLCTLWTGKHKIEFGLLR